MIDPTERARLTQIGFIPVVYAGQEGEYLVARVPMGCMKDAGARLIDEDFIFEDTEAVTEVTPCGQVQLYVPDADLLDDRQPLESDEGRRMVAEAAAAILLWMDRSIVAQPQ